MKLLKFTLLTFFYFIALFVTVQAQINRYVEISSINGTQKIDLLSIDSLSIVSVPVNVTLIEPLQGGANTIVTVSGTGLNLVDSIYINGRKSPILYKDSIKIKFIANRTGKPTLYTQYGSVKITQSFNVLRPYITSISRSEVEAGDTITIIGENFGDIPDSIRCLREHNFTLPNLLPIIEKVNQTTMILRIPNRLSGNCIFFLGIDTTWTLFKNKQIALNILPPITSTIYRETSGISFTLDSIHMISKIESVSHSNSGTSVVNRLDTNFAFSDIYQTLNVMVRKSVDKDTLFIEADTLKYGNSNFLEILSEASSPKPNWVHILSAQYVLDTVSQKITNGTLAFNFGYQDKVNFTTTISKGYVIEFTITNAPYTLSSSILSVNLTGTSLKSSLSVKTYRWVQSRYEGTNEQSTYGSMTSFDTTPNSKLILKIPLQQ